jgi:hypothetical protein
MSIDYARILEKLTESSIRQDRNPHLLFDWPDAIGEDEWMLPPDLMSVYGTPQMDSLDQRTLKALSRWESANFYSMTLHGERELIIVIAERIHTRGFEVPSDFFHRFIGEENDHIWMFSEFCRRYGKIYPDSLVRISTDEFRPEVDVLLSFLRILIFEELGDYFNIRMSGDSNLPEIVRNVNKTHHQDESRHIAGGRQLVIDLYKTLTPPLSAAEQLDLHEHLKQFVGLTLQSFYNPEMYGDAGIPSPYQFRKELLRQPARRAQHERFLARPLEFLIRTGIVKETATLY